MKMKTEAKRQAILEVARQAFQELGFERTSMSEICARVGGSKATLYNYFPSKEVLFFEVMSLSTEAACEVAHEAIRLSAEDIAESLRHFGEKFLAFVYSPEVRAQRHLAISESGRTELGRLVYERGVLRSQNLIAEFLQAAMNLGKLRQTEREVATRHLYALLESELLDRFLFRVLGELSTEQIKAVTARAIDVFMAAYGPRPAGNSDLACHHGKIEADRQSPRPKGRGLWWIKPQVWIDQTQPRTSGYVADRLKTHPGMLPQSQALKVPVADPLRVSTKRIGT